MYMLCNRRQRIFSQRNDQFIEETNSLIAINKNMLLRDNDDIFVTLFLYMRLTYGASLNNQVGMCLI